MQKKKKTLAGSIQPGLEREAERKTECTKPASRSVVFLILLIDSV